jgi:NAD(P)-dependent dehydrogenase (short-subunit alcohol dehydrogenase family)
MSKRAWVIGGTSGIGKSAVQSLALYDIEVTGPEVDVRDRNQLNLFLDENAPFDVIVYCAGINHLDFIGDISNYIVMDMFDVNVIGFINVVNRLLKYQQSGKIICVVSSAADTPMRGSIAYCSSKAALKMAVKCTARELAPSWSVIGVSPIAVDGTAMTKYIDATVPRFRGWTPEQAREYELDGIPMGRRPSANEVGELIAQIADMNDFMSGSIIEFGGGK